MGKTFGIALVYVLGGAMPGGTPMTVVWGSLDVIDYRLQILEQADC
jgi:hypothetical protein